MPWVTNLLTQVNSTTDQPRMQHILETEDYMANKEIRCALVNYGIKQYQLAESLGMVDTALSRKLRKELAQEEKEKILATIERLAKEAC